MLKADPKSQGSRFVFEIIFVWTLVFFRFFSTPLYMSIQNYFNHFDYLRELILVHRAYAYFIPFESILSFICIWIGLKKIVMFRLDKSMNTVLKGLFVILPLIIISIFSLYWLFIAYPAYITKRYYYFNEQHLLLKKTMQINIEDDIQSESIEGF